MSLNLKRMEKDGNPPTDRLKDSIAQATENKRGDSTKEEKTSLAKTTANNKNDKHFCMCTNKALL